MIKKLLIIIILVTMVVTVIDTVQRDETHRNFYSRDYYIENGYRETGSKNLVTAIYLDYRLFDSIFEASILLISVAGIIFMAKRDDQII